MHNMHFPVDWGFRIHRLHPANDTQQSNSEVPVKLEFWECEYHFIAIAPRSTLALEWKHLIGSYL